MTTPHGASRGAPGVSSDGRKPRRRLDSLARPRYGGAMRYPGTGGLTAGAVLLTLLAAIGCRQPQPQATYEYGETETTITTTPPPGRAMTTSTLAAPKEPTWKRREAQ